MKNYKVFVICLLCILWAFNAQVGFAKKGSKKIPPGQAKKQGVSKEKILPPGQAKKQGIKGRCEIATDEQKTKNPFNGT